MATRREKIRCCESGAVVRLDRRPVKGVNQQTAELPGFYYDVDKKKYFRIVPSHSNAMTGAITPEVVGLKQAALERQAVLNVAGGQTDSRPSRYVWNSQNIISLISDRHRGCLTNRFLQYNVLCNFACNLTHCGYESMSSCCNQYVFSHPVCLMLSAEQDQLICLWSMVRQTCGSLYSFVQRYDIVNIQKESCGRTSLQLKAAGHQTYRPSHISSICWTGDILKSFRPVLYTASVTDGAISTVSYAVVDMITSGNSDIDDAPSIPALYRIGNRWTWSCASNSTGSHFAVGTEKKCLVFDAQTGRRHALDTHNSDTLSVCFANTSDEVLFSGTRGGDIYCYRSGQLVDSFHHSSSVFSLNIMRDDCYMIAADCSGQVKQWDLRQKKVVTSYMGNINKLSSQMSVGLDNHENILYAVGSDGCCRLWEVKTGKMLTTIVPPFPVTKTALPSVCLSNTFGKASYPGLILGSKNEFHFYAR